MVRLYIVFIDIRVLTSVHDRQSTAVAPLWWKIRCPEEN